ncbi:MAG: YggS family pyridoxal phosphate-dependent enzyme [Trueperaceae bacterium]|nr:YggS family pyridoxal phosphate-dependent enzyme [Trueperaceae bacterium]
MLADVLERIDRACARAGRDHREVRLVAVTKGHDAESVRAAVLAHGHRILGENRVQEWRAKAEALGPDVEWHLVGHLQTNKVRYCRGFALLHGVDSARLIDALEADGERHDHVFPVLLQVNVSGEIAKHGADPAALGDLVARVRAAPHVRLEGLMTMAPYDPEPERARPVFRALRALAERHADGRTSMGMSGDFEVAIEEGATWIRVGSALFAPGATRPNEVDR